MLTYNAVEFLKLYDTVLHGRTIFARGLECREVEDYLLTLHTNESVLTSFRARQLSLNYCKQEFLWYLRADRYDSTIEQYASMWQKLRQPDGGYNSNYGQYIFGGGCGSNQFDYVVQELIHDEGSRRASMVLLQPWHLYRDNTDTVCTYGLNFRIRDGALHMTVMMRSNDVVFGTTNDVFCFWGIYLLIKAILSETYPELEFGYYHHFVNSLHVYKRHYEMLERIVAEGESGYEPHTICLNISPKEARALIDSKGGRVEGTFSEWLHS